MCTRSSVCDLYVKTIHGKRCKLEKKESGQCEFLPSGRGQVNIARELSGAILDNLLEQPTEGRMQNRDAKLWQTRSMFNLHTNVFCKILVRSWNKLSTDLVSTEDLDAFHGLLNENRTDITSLVEISNSGDRRLKPPRSDVWCSRAFCFAKMSSATISRRTWMNDEPLWHLVNEARSTYWIDCRRQTVPHSRSGTKGNVILISEMLSNPNGIVVRNEDHKVDNELGRLETTDLSRPT